MAAWFFEIYRPQIASLKPQQIRFWRPSWTQASQRGFSVR